MDLKEIIESHLYCLHMWDRWAALMEASDELYELARRAKELAGYIEPENKDINDGI